MPLAMSEGGKVPRKSIRICYLYVLDYDLHIIGFI